MKKTVKKLVLQKDTLVRVTGGITAPTYYRCGPNPHTVNDTLCVDCVPSATVLVRYCCLLK